MIGLRYLVAVRSDLLVKDNGLMDGVVEAVMKGLADGDDDVRAVSAATLIPIAIEFVALRPAALDDLMNIIWDCLSDVRDDLSASTGFVMDLLAKLCSFPEVLVAMQKTQPKTRNIRSRILSQDCIRSFGILSLVFGRPFFERCTHSSKLEVKTQGDG